MRNKRLCYPLTISDNYSRYLLACQGLEGPRYEETRYILERTFREYGLPKAIRSDNGHPFAGKCVGGLSRLSIWWIQLGIIPERIAKAHPEQNGRHERMHRTLKEEVLEHVGKNLADQQREFDLFHQEYNNNRPHEALGQDVPAIHYRHSERLYRNKPLSPEYDYGFTVRQVRSSGDIKINGMAYFLTELLKGEHVGLKEIEDGKLKVYYSFFSLGIIDLRKKIWNAENYAIVLIISALILLAGVELFFVKDVYSIANPPYFRANTVFKFGFHTWILLAFSAMVLAGQATEEYRRSPIKMKKIKPHIRFLAILISALVFLGLYYPYQAVNQFYLSAPPPYSLDGLLFLKKLYPDDYEAVQWIKKNIGRREVMVEAAGDSYSDYGRLSVFTGSISPINWLTHEWTWRFKPQLKNADPGVPQESGWRDVSMISLEVRQIFESPDLNETLRLINKYEAKYVYIGDLERTQYPALNEAKFYALGEVIFNSGNSKLFKIKN